MDNRVFCRECGAENTVGNFCTKCGAKLVTYTGPSEATPELVSATVSKLRTSAAIWTVIGIIQVCMVFMPWTMVIGIWNLVMSGRVRKNAKLFESGQADLAEFYRADSDGHYYVSIVANLLGGAFIGVIGAIYDLSIRRFVINNLSQKAQSYASRGAGV